MYTIIKSLLFGILTLAMLTGCEKKEDIKPNGKVIEIGVIAPLNGKDSAMGTEAVKGLKILLKAAPMTIDGTRIKLIIKNDKSDVNTTIQHYREFALNKDIDAVIVISESKTLLKIAGIADRYRLPTLNIFATHPDISKNSRYISNICFNNTHQGQVAALYIRDDLLLDRVAIFYDQKNPYSSTLSREFEEKFKRINGSVVAMIPSDYTDSKLEKELNFLKKEGTDLLYLTQDVHNILEVIDKVKKMGWDVTMMSRDGLLSRIKSNHKKMVSLADGLLVTDHFSAHMPLSDLGEEIVKEYVDDVDDITNFAALSAEGYLLLKHALEQCGNSIQRECINMHLRNVEQFRGFAGDFDIKEGNAARPVIISKIKDGKMHFIVKVY